MKEILIPLNFTTTPTVYDTKQSFSTSDEASGVLIFTTTEDVAGTVASLTIRNASENANRQTVLIERLDVNSSPFRYTLKNPLPFGQYEGTVLLKKNLTVIASATFLFGVNSSLATEVLPDLVRAYSLDELVENVETEVSNLKDAYNLTVSETVKGVNKTESSLQAQENVRYLNEHTRKANELERISNEQARVAAELARKETFDTLVDSEMIEQTVAQEVASEFQQIEATYANRLLSTEQQLADTLNKSAITLTHMFADNSARDAYFVANPSELMEQLFIKVGTGYQQYIEGVWTDSVPIVSETLNQIDDLSAAADKTFSSEKIEVLLSEKITSVNNIFPDLNGNVTIEAGGGTTINDSVTAVDSTWSSSKIDGTKANKEQEAWITPTLLNGWVGNQATRYLRDQFGFVHLKGILISGTMNTTIFNLPVGYRPINNYNMFSVASGSVNGVLLIRPNGDVIARIGTSTEFCLDGVTFKAEA